MGLNIKELSDVELLDMLQDIINDLLKRGYGLSCDTVEYDLDTKMVEFDCVH